MRIVNNKGLPQAVFEALCHREYSKEGADISVTELIDSPRVRGLKRLKSDQIEVEADTLLAAFLGTAFHKGIEIGTKTGTAERRLFIDVLGWRLSGGMDHYHEGVLTDYKTLTTFKVGKRSCPDGRIEDFENQLNVYAHILRENGHPVKKLMLFALFKDWNRGGLAQAAKGSGFFVPYAKGGYPTDAWMHFEIKLWAPKVAKSYVRERVKLHQKAEKVKKESALPLCTRKEIWDGIRCERYCLGARWCSQYSEQKKTGLLKKAKSKGEINEISKA